jgi:hypothetical protein
MLSFIPPAAYFQVGPGSWCPLGLALYGERPSHG